MPLMGPRPDADQVLQNIYDPTNNAIQINSITGALVPKIYDSISLTYWTSGNGIGQIETVSYYQGGLSGTLVATLTLNYNVSAQISSVVRT